MTREEMIKSVQDMMEKMHYEDAEFFFNMISLFMEKKGMK